MGDGYMELEMLKSCMGDGGWGDGFGELARSWPGGTPLPPLGIFTNKSLLIISPSGPQQCVGNFVKANDPQ